MSLVNLVWTTPNGESLIAYMARVSNPSGQSKEDNNNKLLKYLVRNKHWSPFEMVNVCMEITTTRDIARQILRHRSFSFQEFSQRYADPVKELSFVEREARLQDVKNRQNSLETDNPALCMWWEERQRRVIYEAKEAYAWAIENGIAKEQARAVLPEGNTTSKMYMNGTLRSWIHYVDLRTDNATQKEHREVALQCKDILVQCYPFLEELWTK